MSFLSYFRTIEDPLAKLRQIVLVLKGEKYDRELTNNSEVNFSSRGQELSNNIEDQETFSKKDSRAKSCEKLNHLHNEDVRVLDASSTEFYLYLYKNQSHFFSPHLIQIANTANTMVRKIDDFLTKPTDEYYLTEAIKAKNEFYRACQLLSKKELTFITLVGAILGCVAGLLVAPAFIPASAIAAKVAFSSTLTICGGLGLPTLVNGYIKPSKHAKSILEKVDSLLPTIKSNYEANPYQKSELNMSEKLRLEHNDLEPTGNFDEELLHSDLEPPTEPSLFSKLFCCR